MCLCVTAVNSCVTVYKSRITGRLGDSKFHVTNVKGHLTNVTVVRMITMSSAFVVGIQTVVAW